MMRTELNRSEGAPARESPARKLRKSGRGRPRSFFLNLVLVAFAIVLTGCGQKEKEKEPGSAQEGEKKPETESRVKHGTNDEVIIALDAKTQKVMGLQVDGLQAAKLPREIKGYGHVIDASPLTSLVADFITGQAAAMASEAELKRLQALAAQSNASERALETAQANAARDQAQVQSIRLKLLANWGNGIAQRPDLPDFVAHLSSLSAVLVQLNLAAGENLTAAPAGARLFSLADQKKPIEAQFLGPAPMTDQQMQSKGFFLLVNSNSTGLASGEAVSGFLTLTGEPVTGVAVPRAAILQFNGVSWVYLQTGEETFQRVELQSAVPIENGLFLHAGLKPGDKVVTVGAQQLLSEELKGQGGE